VLLRGGRGGKDERGGAGALRDGKDEGGEIGGHGKGYCTLGEARKSS
ncbi:MAG: hypothetical protein RL376_294, partial [Verrucomicrobiota bacterium]